MTRRCHGDFGPFVRMLLVFLVVVTSATTRVLADEGANHAAAARVAPLPRGPHPVVVPPYRARIRAAHRLHAEQAKMTCVDCHVDATSSPSAADSLVPPAKRCAPCHEPNHERLEPMARPTGPTCLVCHIDSSGSRQPSHLRHSHAAHARRNIGCPQCHGRVDRLPDAIGSERLPTKPTCTRCHAGRGRLDGQARADCIVCHESAGGRMRTRFRGQVLLPTRRTPSLEHGNDWLFRHRDVAGNDPRRCEGCHTQRDCQACHDGRLRPRNIHPSDWLSAHAIASKQEGASCNACHRQQSFCLSCHQRLGLGASGAAAAMAQRGALHPPSSVWVSGSKGPQHHGTQARRNISECVSCHQERDCVRCHAAGTPGLPSNGSAFGVPLNPHPPGFSNTCSVPWARNPRPCLSCHRPESSELQRCQ